MKGDGFAVVVVEFHEHRVLAMKAEYPDDEEMAEYLDVVYGVAANDWVRLGSCVAMNLVA